MKVSDIIRSAREKSGLSQRELAKLARVSHGAVANWESGFKIPSDEVRRRLAAALQINPVVMGVDKVPVLHVTDPLTIKMVTTFERLPARAKKNIADIVEMAGDIAREINEHRNSIEPPTLHAV